MVLMRGTDEKDFGRSEVALLDSVGKVVAEGLRRATVLTSRPGATPDGPGLILCNVSTGIEVTHITPTARQWLEELQDGVDHGLPYAVMSLIQAIRHSTPADGDRRTRLRTRAGRWLTLHATSLGEGTVSVIVEPTQTREVASMMLDAFRLTPREREVAMLAAHGLSNTEIGNRLFLSSHTVGDHLKSAFSKAGVNRRTELAAKLMLDPMNDLPS
jgi:DNA-binding CsgD family transcriptional regulator